MPWLEELCPPVGNGPESFIGALFEPIVYELTRLEQLPTVHLFWSAPAPNKYCPETSSASEVLSRDPVSVLVSLLKLPPLRMSYAVIQFCGVVVGGEPGPHK